MPSEAKRVPRWYFGGLASAAAIFFTHPLDLLKVHMQTQPPGKKLTITQLLLRNVKNNGIMGLYNGLSASILRQLTYNTFRFGAYDYAKILLGNNNTLTSRILVAAFAGSVGGFIGTPSDKVNVRMQRDIMLPREKRLNYKHAIDGLLRVYKEEGTKHLFTGGAAASVRAGVMAIGQLVSYDQIKMILLGTSYFEDNVVTHFTSSLGAGVVATTMTQPMDVIKTRLMSAKPGDYNGIMDVVVQTAKEGPMGFFRGYVPAFLRLAPQIMLTYIIYEQLIAYFGYIPEPKVANA